VISGGSEPPNTVDDSSSSSGSHRWLLSYNWENDEGKVGPRASPRSLKAIEDLSTGESDVEVKSIQEHPESPVVERERKRRRLPSKLKRH
jgi:hypothetical protein